MDLVMSLVLLLLAFIASALFIVHRALIPHTLPKGKTNIPGPTVGRTWPILGDVLHFNGMWTPEEMFKKNQFLCKMREKAMSFWIGSKLMILVTDADLLEKLLNSPKCLNKDPDFYNAFREFTKGFFSLNGKKWAELRRPLDKIMHSKNMETFYEVFNYKAAQLCDIFDGYCDKGEVDVKHDAPNFTFDTVLETLMGVPSTQMAKNTLNFPAAFSRSVLVMYRRMMKLEYKFDWIFRLSSDYQEQKHIIEEFRLTSRYIQDMRKKEYAKNGVYPGDTDFEPANYADVVIHTLTQHKWPQDDLERALLDVVFAGYDTSSVAISSALLFLAMHPEYQRKAYEEQVRIMGNSLSGPTPSEMSQMEYLKMVFDETVRLTCVPSIARILTKETVIDDMVFPEGAALIFSLQHICIDPKYWTNPDEFYPDHFLLEATAARPKGAFMPFASGMRVCPGKRFTNISSRIILSMVLRRFILTTRLKFKEMSYKYMIMQESKEGYPLRFTRRIEAS